MVIDGALWLNGLMCTGSQIARSTSKILQDYVFNFHGKKRTIDTIDGSFAFSQLITLLALI